MQDNFRSRGIGVLVNEEDKKIWIVSGADITGVLRAKFSAIDSLLNRGKRYTDALPSLLVEDMEAKGKNVIDKIYILTCEDLTTNNRREKQKKIDIIKLYLKNDIFREYDYYVKNDVIEKHDREYRACKEDTKNMVENMIKNYIDIYVSKDVTYRVMQEFRDSILIGLEVLKKEIGENNNMSIKLKKYSDKREGTGEEEEVEKIDRGSIVKLLEVESILRGISIEELLEGIVSDKSKEIVKYINK